MNALAGKTAVVTGASRGSGRAAALALARAGAQVIVHDGRGASETESVVREIRGIGSRCGAIAADLSTREGPYRLARQIRAIVGERLDILVANAGMSVSDVADELSVEEFDQRLALDIRATLFLIQQLLPIMCMRSNVTFLLLPAHEAGSGLHAVDAAIRGAMETLVRHFAFALGGRGIRVNGVAEGYAHARTTTPALADHARESRGDDVGSIISFLASDAARWITGEIVRVSERERAGR
ncbi:SDR family oxidoreductase [Caballeronia sp. GAFFF1]|uniref:SDR family NAD(P)-dependent oxidoreductase n=1 Tax=Caballeronia sp. GAFFF1 TaxID=2921779 RepID=UPI002028C423|nr:SDR family oxidoreductase [Caballeronia sp. GAFFF1]